ncbi:MAG: M20 family metallopeptidase [Acidobacteriota bacterium]
MDPKEILEYFRSRQPSMINAISEIVEIESPSHDPERNRKAADWVEAAFRGIPIDLSIERIAAEGFGDHLLIKAFPENKKGVLVLGHIDTVHPVGTKEKNPTRVEDGRMYGCGIFDMKANVVVMIEALRYLAQTGIRPPLPLTFLLSCDEEVGSFSGRELVENEAVDSEFCLVCEPSSLGRVKTGRKGTGVFTLKAHGLPAHAGLEPERGASAILELARQIEKLQALNDPSAGTSVNVCTIRGGTTTNVIPEHAECTIDVRFTSTAAAKRILSVLRTLKPFDERVTLSVLGDINRPPMERTAAVAALYEKARSIAASFDYELGETQVGGGSDGNFVGALGVPVLDGLGIFGDGAHTLHEHILVSDIAKRATLVTLLLAAG